MLLTVIAIIIVFVAIIIGQFIVNPTLQPVYWMLVFLLFVSVANIYMTFYYYIKLRNEPGIKGERGSPGLQGEGGGKGVCVINTQCDSIQLCDQFIKEHLKELLPEYEKVLDKQNNSQLLNNRDRSILSQIQTYTGILKPKCESGKYSKEEMKTLIENSFNKK